MKKTRISRYGLLLILLISFFISQAQGEEEAAGVIALSLQEVSDLALKNSFDIQIAKFDAYMQRTSLAKAESIFDTFLDASISFNRDKRMQSSTILGEEEKEYSYSLSLEKKLPTGTTLTIGGTGKKVRTDSTFASMNPYNEAEVELSVNQALGKNFFGLTDRSEIKITKLDIENSDFTSLDNIEQGLFVAQRAYWNLVLKDTQLQIRKEMLEAAKDLYKVYQDKFDTGLVEETELLAMEALVSARLSQVYIAELERETAKNELLFLINYGEFQEDIKSKDVLSCDLLSVELYDELRLAIDTRRDYRRAQNELRKNKINVIVKKNALWPEIDLTLTLTRNNLDANRGKSWEGLKDNSNDNMALMFSILMPLENRNAKADLEKIKLEMRKLILSLKKVERQILKELNDSVNQVNTMQQEAELFKTTVKIHEKKLERQIERLNYGRSDADTLIRYEEDLLNARLSLANYLFEYRVSLMELALAKNTLLDSYWKEPL